jgi:hypothetical protein
MYFCNSPESRVNKNGQRYLGIDPPELSTFDSLLSTEVNALVEARKKYLQTHNPVKLKELTSYGKLPEHSEEDDKLAMERWEKVKTQIMASEPDADIPEAAES